MSAQETAENAPPPELAPTATDAVISGFGAAGALLAVLVRVYYSAQIFLLGAEFTWVYAHRLGSRRGMDATAPTQ